MSLGDQEIPNVPQPPERHRPIGPRMQDGAFRARQHGPSRRSLGKQFGPKRYRGSRFGPRLPKGFKRARGARGGFGRPSVGGYGLWLKAIRKIRQLVTKGQPRAKLQGVRNHGFTGIKRAGKTGLAGR